MTWKASAPGMTDQIITTTAEPVFNLALPRSSADVTIEVTSPDGADNFIELKVNSLNIIILDLSGATGLQILSCTDNQLRELSVQTNIKLQALFCHSNQLTTMDVNNNTDLKILSCFSNQIAELSLLSCRVLNSLSCSRNLMKQLDMSANPLLNSLECDQNSLESLNLKNGNNQILQKLNTTSNSNLFCIQVDNQVYADNTWKDIDPWTKFNTDCTFINENPVANDDQYETDDNTRLEISDENGLLLNDSDPEEDALTVNLVTDAAHGTLDLQTDGSFIYMPDPYFFGSDTFSYRSSDGALLSEIAMVTITVTLVNEGPVAENDRYTGEEGELLSVNSQDGLLKNDNDPDNDPLIAEMITQTVNGTLNLSPDGSFTYEPISNFFGTDTFTYRVFDGYVYSQPAVVTIDIAESKKLVVPNGFTPNGDGMNDTFRPVFRGFTNIRLQIFDTWGNLLFLEDGIDLTGWNGQIKNAMAENGNYLYKIKATSEDAVIEKEGLFTLIR